MTIGDRFKIIREELRLNQSELARSIGANPSIISDIERGDKEPSKKIISTLIVKYRVNSNWLLTGQGNKYTRDDFPSKSRFEQGFEEAVAAHPKFTVIEERLSALEALLKQEKLLPETDIASDTTLYTAESSPFYGEEEEDGEYEDTLYVHSIAAGPPIWLNDDRSETVRVPARLLKKGERYYVAKIQGSSMTKAGILDGDMILVRYTDVPRDGAIQVVRYQEQVTLKRMCEVEGKGWELRYMDGSGKVITCDSDEYETLGELMTVLPKKCRPSPP
ncbi:MAG: helix-turn-helix domain-containing protein [Treponema sp.]|nr:helix-turn-helix domain-containing protein [Treponema sp.]